MFLFTGYERKKKAWQDGVAHITLDPEGPGVARLHLVPPKPSLFKDPPSLLVINGTWFLPVGPSWAAILRIFFDELQSACGDKREISPEEAARIEASVVDKVKKLYPGVKPDMIREDLREIVALAVNIATNRDVPEETFQAFNLAQYGKHMTAPHRMDLIVAPMSIEGLRACPLECACCYADSGTLMDIEEPMTTEEWKEIIDKCREAGIPMLTFTGGEPLTRPDIVDLVMHAAWFITRINSNGYLLTPELARKLREASLDGIQITIYSHDPAVHDALVGKEGAWKRTVEGIRNALAAGLSTSVNTPLVHKNRDYTSTIRFLHDLGINHLGCSSLIPAGNAVKQIEYGRALSPDELRAILGDAVSLCNELDMNISFTSPGWLGSDEILKLGLPSAPMCGACLSNMAVAPNGQVVPCQSWLNGPTLGDIRRKPWKSIWESAECRSIRKNHAGKPKCALKGDIADD
jgi:MoaA/NifB/PqqE/SkfB family radical SAM enzyme